MEKILILLLLVTLAIGSVTFINQTQSGKGIGKTCIFGSPCCNKESDIDWETGFVKK